MKYEVKIGPVVIDAENEQEARTEFVQAVIEDQSLVEAYFVAPFCRWLFQWLGASPVDNFDDLFPGSGAVGRAWDEFAAQPSLTVEPTMRSKRRARAKAMKAHPTIGDVA